jgi:hypothetical protein
MNKKLFATIALALLMCCSAFAEDVCVKLPEYAELKDMAETSPADLHGTYCAYRAYMSIERTAAIHQYELNDAIGAAAGLSAQANQCERESERIVRVLKVKTIECDGALPMSSKAKAQRQNEAVEKEKHIDCPTCSSVPDKVK